MKKSRRRKVRAYIYTHRHKYMRHERNAMEGGWGGVEINSLHPEDRYDTPRKYSTSLEIDTTVNLFASSSRYREYTWQPRGRAGRGTRSMLSLFLTSAWWRETIATPQTPRLGSTRTYFVAIDNGKMMPSARIKNKKMKIALLRKV